MVRIAVLGAGIVGLTTAVNVQALIPQASVTIIADKFGNNTTSAGAGGIFRPSLALIKDVEPEIVKAWLKDSWDYFFSLAMSAKAKETGQGLVSGFMFSDDLKDIEDPLYKDLLLNFRVMTDEECRRLNPKFKYGCFFTTIITQTKKFMPWLMTQFKAKGGWVEFGTVAKIEELAGRYDVIINCTGLGSRQLLNDQAMYPVKGQLAVVEAPWIKTFAYGGHKTYFIPHDQYVIVGGTREEGIYSDNIVPRVQEDILERAAEVLPQIKGARVISSWAGLRPHRDPLRLEKELLVVNGKNLGVVHNYGHGANGVSLSWGTAIRAAKLAQELSPQVVQYAKL